MSDERVLLTVREIEGAMNAVFCGSEHQLYACIQTVVEASVNAGADKEMVMFAVAKGISRGMRMRSKD